MYVNILIPNYARMILYEGLDWAFNQEFSLNFGDSMRPMRDGLDDTQHVEAMSSTSVASFSARQLATRSQFMRLQAGLIILIAVLNIADGVLTYLGLTFFEVAEANPILELFSSRLGLGSAIIFIKAIIISGLVLMFFRRSCVHCYTNIATLFVTNIFYLWVVGNNTDLVLFSNFNL